MVGIGLLMLALVAVELVAALARAAVRQRAGSCALCNGAAPLGFVAVLAGWTTTEVGRQPWTVYGLMRTRRLGVAVADRRATSLLSLLGYIVGLSDHVPGRRHAAWRGSSARARRPGASADADRERPRRARRSPARSRQPEEERHDRMVLDLVPLWTADPRRSACSSTCCSTASISASACSTASRPTRASRNLMMNSIAPIWDGNETWLVLGGVGLLAAFPLAFAIIIPAVYFPILVMLLGAGLPRRRVRVPLPRRRAPDVLGPRLLLRLG